MGSLFLAHSLQSLRPSLHNGPGWRVSMWVQGCSLRCTNRCLNPQMLGTSRKEPISVLRIVEELQKVHQERKFEGITILGGEPSEQPEGLAALLEEAHRNNWTTMVYSGHTYEHLKQQDSAQKWLSYTDILVDGPYKEEEYDDFIAWRGSRNQQILCLSNAYTPQILEERFQEQGKGFSIYVNERGQISVSGIQNRDAAYSIEKLVNAKEESEE